MKGFFLVFLLSFLTLHAVTRQEGLNSGLYHFTSTEADVDMEVYHLPFTVQFHSSDAINYFLVGVESPKLFILNKNNNLTTELYLNGLNGYNVGIGFTLDF